MREWWNQKGDDWEGSDPFIKGENTRGAEVRSTVANKT